MDNNKDSSGQIEKFEEWARRNGFQTRRRDDPESPDTFFHYETEQRWTVWRGAVAAQAEQSQSAGSARKGGDTSDDSSEKSAAAIASQSQAAQPTEALKDERALFEAWAVSDDGGWMPHALWRNPAGHEFDYKDDDVQSEWRAWQARAHIAGTSQATKAQIECEWPTCECVLDLDNCKASREAQAGSARDAALARMERAEWYAVFSALRDARTALSKGDIQHTWLDGAITLAEARVKGQGDHAAAPTGQATKAQADNKLKSNPVDAQKTEDLAIKAQDEPEEWRTFLQMWTHDGALQTFSNRQKFRNAAFALLAAPVAKEAPAVLEGWKLVPVEPTDEMRTACKVLNYADDIDAEWARLLAAAPQAPVAMAEPEAPAILGAISYHARERDDLTLEEAVEAFRHGYKKVRQRDDRAMLLQLIHLMASVPVAATKEAESVQAALEQIAQSWDGCMVDAPGGEMDVAATLRSQFKGIETGVQANVLPPFAAPAGQHSAGIAHGDIVAAYTRWMHDSSQFPHADDTRHPFEAFSAGVNAASRFRAQGGNTNANDNGSDLATTTSTVSAPNVQNPYSDYLAPYWQAGFDGDDIDATTKGHALAAYSEGIKARAAPSSTEGTQAAPQEVRNQALEDAVKACEGEQVEVLGEPDRAYNLATEHCAYAIRALKRTSTDQANADTGSAE